VRRAQSQLLLRIPSRGPLEHTDHPLVERQPATRGLRLRFVIAQPAVRWVVIETWVPDRVELQVAEVRSGRWVRYPNGTLLANGIGRS
jgi:hypothetical protein